MATSQYAVIGIRIAINAGSSKTIAAGANRSWMYLKLRPANIPTINGVIILDDDGKRITAKYYNSTRYGVMFVNQIRAHKILIQK